MGSGVNDAKAVWRDIDGHTYEMRKLGMLAARNCLLRVGASMAGVFRGGGGKAGAMVAMLPAAEVDYLAELFGAQSHARAAGADPSAQWVPLVVANHEAHFDGRLSAYFAWILFGLEVNIAPFFADGLLTSAMEAIVSAATPKASPSK